MKQIYRLTDTDKQLETVDTDIPMTETLAVKTRENIFKPELKTTGSTGAEMTSDELRAKMRDPNFLPTLNQIKMAFDNREQWHEFFYDKEQPVFELYTEEYLDGLSDYFVSKLNQYGARVEKPLTILEVGAGNGRLSHFLRQKLEEKIPGKVKVVASDSGEWNLKSDFPVEKIDVDKAMEKYSPDVVVFSWMPDGEDSSKHFRKTESVKEYVLIGESNGETICPKFR